MDGFEVFVFCTTYGMITTLFAVMLDEKENTLGRAFIWPMILLIASIKAVRSVYLETKEEIKDWNKPVNKK
jgi:hypothetical protein